MVMFIDNMFKNLLFEKKCNIMYVDLRGIFY